MLNNNTDSY